MSDFYVAAKAVVDGDVDALVSLLQADVALVSARSPKHGATLLHYVGANGPVEDDMQKTPDNAVAIAEALISHGADVDAIIEGDSASTPLVSLVTSEFPAKAGIQHELVTLFLKSRAAINGLEDNGYPLACAMLFGYPDAITALVEGGARIDNVVAAAGLGRTDYLRRCFDESGKLTSQAGTYPDPFRREIDERGIIQIAMEHAQQHEQAEAVNFLARMTG